jgi:hypothetical protein
MANENPPNKYTIELEFDPSSLTEAQIKQIADKITADIARAAAGSRGGSGLTGGFSQQTHNKGSIFGKA